MRVLLIAGMFSRFLEYLQRHKQNLASRKLKLRRAHLDLSKAPTFGFIKGLKPGNLSVAIIHQLGNAASEADVQALNKGIGDGLKVGKFTLIPRYKRFSNIYIY